MEGFVIAKIDEETGESVQFWNGESLVDDATKSHFFTDKVNARLSLANIQGQVPSVELRLIPARLTVVVGG